MNYDPKSQSIVATGSVHYTAPEGELFGDRGIGYTNGRMFEMSGSVIGHFALQSLDISCDFIELEIENTSPPRRKLSAAGRVSLVRGRDKLSSASLAWELDRENYEASGDVLMEFESYFMDSDEAGREGERFWARNVRRYEDRARRMTISASKVNGLIESGSIVELTAEGAIVMNVRTNGANTTIRGGKGVFSEERGTIVVSGGAFASQAGRNLSAGNIVYHLDCGRVEALGVRPTITFEMID
jgi:hypothetical protein